MVITSWANFSQICSQKNMKTKRVTRYPGIIQGLSREPWISSFCSFFSATCSLYMYIYICYILLLLTLFYLFIFYNFLLLFFYFFQWKSSENPGNPGEIQENSRAQIFTGSATGPPKIIFWPNKLWNPIQWTYSAPSSIVLHDFIFPGSLTPL